VRGSRCAPKKAAGEVISGGWHVDFLLFWAIMLLDDAHFCAGQDTIVAVWDVFGNVMDVLWYSCGNAP